MPHQVACRELTPEEASDLDRRSRLLSGMSGCDIVMVPVGIAGCITLLWILLWVPVAVVVRLLGREPSSLINNIMLFGIFIIGAVAWTIFFIRFLVTASRRRHEKVSGPVEEIQVDAVAVVRRKPREYGGPVYCFDLDDGHVLILQGPWLQDPKQFEPAGAPFPASAFTVHRLAKSDYVMKVEIHGPALEIAGEIPARRKLPMWATHPRGKRVSPDSLLIDGPFSEFAALATLPPPQE